MKCKLKDSIFNINKDLLTRQRAVLKGKRRGDYVCVIVTRFTCQRALCNRGKRQEDSLRAIATRFTCQRALCNRGKRQGDSQRAIDTHHVHGSSTGVQNRVQLREKLLRTYEKLVANMRNYESLSTTMRTLYVKELRILEKIIKTHDAQGDLGNV